MLSAPIYPVGASRRVHPVRLRRPPLAIVLLLLELPLIANPGYFSHDELEWWARADVPTWHALPWVSWLDVSPLQYRPLTFDLWLALAHAFAATPWLMHLAFVALGVANACLLARVMTGAQIPARVAWTTAIVFSLCPYAVYVHGWTGTLADILVLGFGLVAALCLQRAATASAASARAIGLAGAVFAVAAALASKESAIVLPLLLPLALRDRLSLRAARFAIALSLVVVAAYLALRLPVLLDSARIDPAYGWSIGHAPGRFIEYLLFPFMPPLFEIAPLLQKSPARIAIAAGCATLLLGALASAGRRWPILWTVAFAVALAPVLVLPKSYDHYAYLASAVAAGIAAATWPSLRRAAKTTLFALAAITTVHGITTMSRMHSVGVVQRNLYGDLLPELERTPDSIAIAPADPRDAWLLERLLHGVTTYRGVRLEGRVHIDSPHSGIERVLMKRDGHLKPSNPD